MGPAIYTGECFLYTIYRVFLFSYNSVKLRVPLLDSVFFHTALFFIPPAFILFYLLAHKAEFLVSDLIRLGGFPP